VDRRTPTSLRRAARARSRARGSSARPPPRPVGFAAGRRRSHASTRLGRIPGSVRPPVRSSNFATSGCRPPNALPGTRIPELARGPCSLVARTPYSPARAATTGCARRCRARRPAP
jgi:hypothetical protein